MVMLDQSQTGAKSEVIFEFHRAHPEISCRQLGKMFGVSGQRVSYILKTQTRKSDQSRSEQALMKGL